MIPLACEHSIAKMEDLVGAGLARFMAGYREALTKYSSSGGGTAASTVEPMTTQSRVGNQIGIRDDPSRTPDD